MGDPDRIPRQRHVRAFSTISRAMVLYHPGGRNWLRPAHAVPQLVHRPEYRHANQGKRLQGHQVTGRLGL